jgi:hypothetical protein
MANTQISVVEFIASWEFIAILVVAANQGNP